MRAPHFQNHFSRLGGLTVFGRSLLALIFLLSGVSKIFGWEQSLAYMSSQGLPMTGILLALAIGFEILCGFSLLLGFRARAGAALLFLYLIPVTLIFHAFWNLQGPEQQMQMTAFMKNLAIMGGLLGIMAHGAGPFSLDARRKRRQEEAARQDLPRLKRVV